MNDTVRTFFDQRGFLEVETPIAVTSPGLEPHLEIFSTVAHSPDGATEQLFLHTSPEYAMKRMLSRQLGNIYQIARVFRNGERSATHAPEFTMVEWYRQPGELKEIADDAATLISQVAVALGGWQPSHIHSLSVSEAYLAAGLGDPLAHIGDLEGLRNALDIPPIDGDDWEAVFFRAFITRVEPSFSPDAVTILSGYPASMAALAKIDPNNPRQARRFEVFVGSLELANAFDELVDPQEQRCRFEEDLRIRKALGRSCPPLDEDLLSELPKIGQAAGIALGLDRLLMRCLQLPCIQDVIPLSPRPG
ncbi:MAG: EF-P lysine aminoacylase GenX [Myxococcales bacterium]|nr:EF-P lysine aminoacylase GenX [Myxococcales bacterium]